MVQALVRTHGDGVGIARGRQQIGVEVGRTEVRCHEVRHIGASFESLRTVLCKGPQWFTKFAMGMKTC